MFPAGLQVQVTLIALTLERTMTTACASLRRQLRPEYGPEPGASNYSGEYLNWVAYVM